MKNSALLNVTLFSIFWALQIFVSKLAYVAGAKPFLVSIQGAIVALIFLWAWAWRSNPLIITEIRKLSPKQLWLLLGINALHFGIGGFLSSFGIALTTAMNAGFLVKFSVVVTSLLAWFFLKEKMTVSKLFSIGLLVAGSFLISTGGKTLIPHLGDALLIIACIAWGIANVAVRFLTSQKAISGDVISLLRPVAGLPTLLLLAGLAPLLPNRVQPLFVVDLWQFQYWPYVLLSGVFTALLWTYLNRTLAIASASYMTMMSMMTSLFTALLGITFLNERMGKAQLIGAACIFIATVLTHFVEQRLKKITS